MQILCVEGYLTIEGYEVYQAGNEVNGVVLGTTNIIKPVGQ